MVWIHWLWNRWHLIFLFLNRVWRACYQLADMPPCPLLKNNCFSHPSVLETTRISTDSILQCNSFYFTSCKSWWSGGLFCIKFAFWALPLEKTIFLGLRKAQYSLYSLDLYLLHRWWAKQLHPNTLMMHSSINYNCLTFELVAEGRIILLLTKETR